MELGENMKKRILRTNCVPVKNKGVLKIVVNQIKKNKFT